MIILKGKDLQQLTEFRNSLESKYHNSSAQGDPEYIEAVNRFQTWCTKAEVDINNYILDMWTGVIFTKEELKAGEVLRYRQQIGLQ